MFEKMFDDEAMVIALELIAELGENVAEELEKRGHTLNRKTPVSNGLAAYEALDLRGESEMMDAAVDMVIQYLYEQAVETMTMH